MKQLRSMKQSKIRKQHKLPVLLAALFSILLLSQAACGSTASAATMHLRKTEGTVGVSDGEGKEVAPAENLGLYSGYAVGTQEESYAWIDLDQVKLAKMDADSKVEIVKEDKNLQIQLKSGRLFFNVTEPLEDDESMDIQTSSMVVGIRGTCGWVEPRAVCLLEGSVTVTAGSQTVTVNAGERAFLMQDGTFQVTPFTSVGIPVFVRGEIVNDEELAKAILDDSGIDLVGASLVPGYDELLGTMENLVYSEMVDFEGDGSPELLTISLDFERGSAADVGTDQIAIYREEPEGLQYLTGGGTNMHMSGTYSLVESDGRLYLRRTFCNGEGEIIYRFYEGSVVSEDGEVHWGEADAVQFLNQLPHWFAGHGENGLVDYQSSDFWSGGGEAATAADIESKYTEVRDLVSYDGTSVTVLGQ